MGEVIDFQDMQAQHRATLEKARQQVENPLQREWGEIFPFRATELPSFPVETLPAWLRDYVKALSIEAQTPIDLAGCLALAVLSLCCAKRAVVGIRGRWKEPVNLYTLVAMESGAGKSPVFRAMMEPVFVWEARTNQDRALEIEQVKQERDLLQQMQLKAKQDVVRSKDPLKRKEAESEVREYTERLQNTPLPNPVRYFVGDVTPERLAGLLEENGERIGILDSEGGIFETIAGRYSDKQTPNLDLILKGHEGGSVRIDRKNAPPLALHSPAITIGLTVQPSVLRGLAQKEGFRDRGLLGRFLYAVPPSKVGTRTFFTEGYSLSLEDCYHEQVTALLSPPVPPFPMELCFSPSAFARFGTFWNEIENRFLPDNPLYALMDWGGKYRGTVARLAGLLHLAESGTQERRQIPLETLERAIVLGEYFQAQAIGVFSEMGLAGASEACRVILEWVLRNGKESFKKRELHRALDSRFPRAEMLTEPLTLLAERGYLREEEEGFKRRMGRPSMTYEVNPAVFVEKPLQEVPVQWEEGEI